MNEYRQVSRVQEGLELVPGMLTHPKVGRDYTFRYRTCHFRTHKYMVSEDQSGWLNELSIRLSLWEILAFEPIGSNPC